MAEIIAAPTADEEAQLMDADVPETAAAVESEPAAEPEKNEEPVATAEPEAEKTEPAKPKEQEILENLKAALRENREEMKAMKRQLEIANELKRQIEEMRAAKPAEPEKPIPSYEEDPLGYSKAKLEQLERQNKEYADRQKALEGATEQQRIATYVTTIENDFRKVTPDYDAAFSHLINVQKKQLELTGYSPEQADTLLSQQASAFSQQAIRAGKNPAQLVYEYAKLYGYRAQEPQAVKEDATKKAVDQTVERLEAVQKGIDKAAKTLSKGGKVETPASVEQLLAAKGDDFDKLWKEIFES